MLKKLTYLLNFIVYWAGMFFVTAVVGWLLIVYSFSLPFAIIFTILYFLLAVLDRPRKKKLQSA